MKAQKEAVIFRRDRAQPRDVFAFFPFLAATCGEPNLCTVYQHIGQHSAGDIGIMVRQSVPARPAEYRDLYRELRRIGYRMRIIKRTPRTAYDERRRQLRLPVHTP